MAFWTVYLFIHGETDNIAAFLILKKYACNVYIIVEWSNVGRLFHVIIVSGT